MASDCDGIPECKDLSDECSDRCKNDINNYTLPEFCDHVAVYRAKVSNEEYVVIARTMTVDKLPLPSSQAIQKN